MRHPLQAAGEDDRRAELAEPAGERERGGGAQPPTASGSATRAKTRHGPAPSVRAAATRVRIDAFEGGDRPAKVEGALHERDGEHDGRLREADLNPERVELVAEEPGAPERGEERDACNRRRQHERQLDQRDHGAPAGKRRRREQVRRRRSDQQHGSVGDRTRLEADDEGVTSDVVAQRAEQITERNTQEDRRDRQEQEGEAIAGRGRESARRRAPSLLLRRQAEARALSSSRARAWRQHLLHEGPARQRAASSTSPPRSRSGSAAAPSRARRSLSCARPPASRRSGTRARHPLRRARPCVTMLFTSVSWLTTFFITSVVDAERVENLAACRSRSGRSGLRSRA